MSRLAIVFLLGRASALPTETTRTEDEITQKLAFDVTDEELKQAEKALEDTPSATLHARRALLSWSTEYCYLLASGELDNMRSLGCVPEPTSAPTCSVGDAPSTSAPCDLGANRRGVDQHRWFDTYAFDHCEQVVVYVSTDASESYYCKGGLQSTGDWSTRRRASAAPDAPESTSDNRWDCWWRSGFEWHDGKCHASKRFLGETCWDDSGECDNEGHAPYSGRHLSCATVPELGITTPSCIPSAFEIQRNSCSCNWFDWYFLVSCGASQCNGHPCVWSTGPGGWMCDYNQGNDW